MRGVRARSESELRSRAREAIREALARGAWVAVSDACIAGGRAAVAWAVFAPSGELAEEGAAAAALFERGSSSDAEAQGAIAAARALDRLGAPGALCLCDCEPAVARLMGPDASALGRSEFDALSRGRYELAWAPRSMMGPANDAARAALGLRPENALARGWEAWMARAARREAPERAGSKLKF